MASLLSMFWFLGLACTSSNLTEFHLIPSVHLTELCSHLRLLLELLNLRHPFQVEAAFVVDIDGNIVLPFCCHA